jgi:hypothetical protein
MSKLDRIVFDESLIIEFVANIVAKTPGVDKNSNFNVTINPQHTIVNVFFEPIKGLANIHQLSSDLQQNVFFNLRKTFDLYTITVNVNATYSKKD